MVHDQRSELATVSGPQRTTACFCEGLRKSPTLPQ
jgi:hypothetical protein